MNLFRSNFRFGLVGCLMTLGSVFAPGIAHANTLTVSNLNDAGGGSLRAAVAAAASGDTINFSVEGVITLTSGQISVAKDLTITGPGASALTVQRSDAFDAAEFRIFNSTAGTLTLSGLTISNGSNITAVGGGAIYSSAALVLNKCDFSGNFSHGNGSDGASPNGGAIWSNGSLTATDTNFLNNNSGEYGGAIYYEGTGTNSMQLMNCSFLDNVSNSGDSIFETGTGKVTKCIFTGGAQTANGGAIRNGGNLTVTGSSFFNNNAGNGGAIFSTEGLLHIENSVFEGNNGEFGGGIYLDSGTLTVNKTLFSGNNRNDTPGDGAGIYIHLGAAATVSSCRFLGGKAHDGSAIFNNGTLIADSSEISGTEKGTPLVNYVNGTLTLTNSTVANNVLGAVRSLNRLAVKQCTFSGNTGGAAISNVSPAGIQNLISYSTIDGNTSPNDGGGIANIDGTLNLQSCIVAGNSGGASPDCKGTIVSQDYNLIGDTTGATLTGNVTHNIYGQDPKLGSLSDNGGPTPTLALLAGSPAIDAGDPSFDSTTNPFDQRGTKYERVRHGRIDIGAYEYQPEVPLITSITFNPQSPRTNDVVQAIVTSNQSSGDFHTFTYTWKKTVGTTTTVLSETTNKLDLSLGGNGAKGDVITFVAVAHGAQGDSVPASAQFTVADTAPVVKSAQFVNALQGTAGKLKVKAAGTDVDLDPFTFTYVWTKKVGDTVTTLSETSDTLDLSAAGNGDFGDQISVTVTAHDGELASAPVTVSTTVGSTVPVIKSVTITPGTPKTNDMLTATVDAFAPDGGALTYTYVWNNSNHPGIPVQSGSLNTFDLSVPGHGDFGDKVRVTVKAVDAHGASASLESTNVFVGNTNPIFPDKTLSGRENHAISGRLWAVDPDGDKQLEYEVQDKAKHGTIDLISLTEFVYTPKANWNGQDTFRLKTIDNGKGSTTALVTVNIAPINARPTANADSVVGTEDMALNIPASTLLKNDVNGEPRGEADPLRIIAVRAATDFPGQLSMNVANQTISITPKANWNGTTTFTYVLEDSGKLQATALVTVKIAAVNDIPVVSNASARVLAGMPLDIALKGSDLEGDALTYTLISKPQHGTAKLVQSGAGASVHYMSTADFSGVETLTFVARDAKSSSAPGTITITVSPNHAPRLVSVSPNTGNFMAGQTVQFEQRVRDQDGASQLDAVALLFSANASSLTAHGGAVLWFNVQTNQFTLSGDDGRSTSAPVGLGQSLENSQVRVTLGADGITTSKDGTLILKWNVTFKAGYQGSKSLWTRVEDLSGASEGFTQVGQIKVDAATTAPLTSATSAPAS